MTAALVILLGGMAISTVILVARFIDAQSWADSLRAYQLRMPANLTADDVTRWLMTVAAATHPASWSLLPMPPISLEVESSPSGIAYYFLVAASAEDKMLSGLRAALPGIRIEEDAAYLARNHRFQVAAEARLTSRARPLAADRATGTSTALLAALQPVPAGCIVRLSWTLTSAGTPRPVRTAQPGSDWTPFLIESEAPADADAVRALRLKQGQPLLRTTGRLGVSATNRAQAYKLLGKIWPVLHAANSPGVRLVRRWLPSPTVDGRMRRRTLPLTTWPMLANAEELTALLALPIGGVQLPGLSLGTARQLPPAPHVARRGAVLGVSNYPGMADRSIALKTADRLMHQYIVGPTGSGKSALITHLAVQDFTNGYGGAVFDPKGDLIADILARLPDEHHDRLIVLDAQDRQRPVGFNLLGNVRDEVERELTVDNVLHIFRSIWADFWGPRTDQVLRAALTTLASARATDGSRFTLCELPALLTNASFRSALVSRTHLSDSVRNYWYRFEALSEAERIQVVSPALNKIDAFVQRVPINLMLGQANGFDMRAIFRERKLLLVNLAKGALGFETSALLGSLLVSSLWQAALSRVQVPPEQRRPVFAFVDECQDLVRLPIALPDMLSQARGLGLGLCLANQYFSQLPQAMQAAVLGTARTTVAFAVDYDDARLLEKRYAPLTAEDLGGLARYEAAVRCCVDGQTLSPCTVTTLPPEPARSDAAVMAARSRERYGTPRAEVEAAMRERLRMANQGGFGRSRPGGRS
jgi:hypothetical protein